MIFMKRFTITLLLFIATSLTCFISGQEFIQSLEQRKGDFYSIQKEANDYYNSKGTGKGSGYKQYKRIEWFLEDRVYPSGDMSLVNGPYLFNEIVSFNTKYPEPKGSGKEWSPVGLVKYNNVDGHWSPGTGRIDRVMVDPTDNHIIYVGAPTGGLSKSVDGGQTWKTKTDDLPSIGICGIAINPINNNVIYIATGDGDGTGTYSSGIYRSDDGGETWNPTSLTFNVVENIQGKKLIIHPTNPDILLFSSTSGIFKTTDAGNTWKLIISGSFDDLEFKPGNPSVVYATKTDAFYRSEDSGNTFEPVNVAASGRIIIGVTQAAPSWVYLACGNEGVYLSTDNGKTFTHRGSHPFSAGLKWYMWGFAVSQSDPSILHIGEMESYKSVNGGLTWDTKTTEWLWGNSVGYTHCDFHEMKYFGNTLYVCTDGGLAKSTDDGENWTIYFNGLETTQIYNMTVCKTDTSRLMFGSQDNGVYYYDGSDWWGWLGADGMDVLYDYENPSIRYATVQNGQLYCNDHTISQAGKGGWVTPITMHPTDPKTLYIATDVVRKSTNRMVSWTTIGTIGSGFKKALVVAESNPDYIYVSEGSKIWRTANGGSLWSDISSGLPNRVITRIAVHPSNPLKVAITFSGYSGGEKVYLSNNGGSSWINISRNLPNIPANAIVFDNNLNNSLYVGMDVGVYYTDDNLALWDAYSEGLPNSIINDLEMNWHANMLYAGTYGRGVWKVPARTPGVTEIPGIATDPEPADASDNVSKLTTLKWTPGTRTETHKIFFGTSNPPPFVANSTTNSYNPGTLSTNTTYYWKIDEENSLGVTEGDIWSFTTDAYCTARGKVGTTTDYISRVQTGNIDNGSGMDYYRDFSDISTEVTKGTEYSITVTLANHWAKDTVAVWIDWDMNNAFTSDEKVEMSVLNSNHISSGNYIVPAYASPGARKIRVRTTYNVTPEPCGEYFGEVEDYTLIVTEDNTFLPGQASDPCPNDGAVNQLSSLQLRWKAGVDTESHILYFGTNLFPGEAEYIGILTDTVYNVSGLQPATTYYWSVDEENSHGIRKGQVWSFTTDSYCTATGIVTETDNYISRFAFESIVNSSSFDSYILYSEVVAEVVTGSDYTADISLGRNETGSVVSLWCDWNSNYLFEEDELTVIDNFNAESQKSVLITVPMTATPGLTRLRIRLLPNGVYDPCNNYAGETEDYLVQIARELAPPDQASIPNPLNNAEFVSTKPLLEWKPGNNASEHEVYFGTTNPPPFAATLIVPEYSPGQLAEDKLYYWRVDEVNPGGKTKGEVWYFTTFSSASPNALKVDFGSDNSPVETGFQPYWAKNNQLESFKSATYGALGNNLVLTPSWADEAYNEAAIVTDRGDDGITPSPDILRDWIGTDNRIPGNPLTLTISGLPAGSYNWTSWHHDPNDQTGLFDVTVCDANGTSVTKNIDISNGSVNIDNITKFKTTIKSDGADVKIEFYKLTESGITGSMFVINGFTLESNTGTSIEDPGYDPDYLSLYPIPADDILNVKFHGPGPCRINVYDQQGKIVYTGLHYGNADPISLKGFSKGFYTLVLFKKGRLITCKFIVR